MTSLLLYILRWFLPTSVSQLFFGDISMKTLILLVPLLAVVAANSKCACDFTSGVLICKDRSLTDFHKTYSSCVHAFWKIDLSENNLQEFPNDLQQFRKVNLSLNSLDHVETSVDQSVHYLDVSHNNIMEINLGHKFPYLRQLIAANNYLGIENDFLDGECNVDHLDVSGNKIKSLAAVARCADLSILEASGNRISTVPKELQRLTNLKVLDLAKNNIKDVSGFPSTLETLNLRENKIQRVSDSSFRGLASLQALDLMLNSISIIEKHAFATLSSLQSLLLIGNKLKSLSSELFKGLKSLRYVDISSNSIASLSNDTFSDLSALERVFLNDNKLTTLPALKFGRNVEEISLAGNSITKMDHSALLAMFSGTRNHRVILLVLNNFRGDDPEWSNILKYFEGECSDESTLLTQSFLTQNNLPSQYDKYTLAASPCACAGFRKGNWIFNACIADGAEVDGLPWLEAAEIYAGNTDKDGGRHSKLKRDEF